MPAAGALIAEAIDLIGPMVKLGFDITDIVNRTKAIATAPTPATADELAAFKAAIDAERAKLNAMTAELDKD